MFRSAFTLLKKKRSAIVKPPKNAHYSAYAAFVKEAMRRPEIAGLANFRERSTTVAALWRGMDAEAKKPYVELAKTSVAVSASQKRQPLKAGGWKDFVKKNYKSVSDLPFQKRLAALKVKYQATKQ